MEFDRRWLDPDKAGAELAARAAEIAADPELLAECFGGELEFGTAGLRGILDAGTARMQPPHSGQSHPGSGPGAAGAIMTVPALPSPTTAAISPGNLPRRQPGFWLPTACVCGSIPS